MDMTSTACLDAARPARRTTISLTTLRHHAAAFLRGLVNRRDIARLQDLSPEQLSDIGLTRQDLRQALSESAFFRDPSARIVHLARSGRTMRG